MKIGRKEKKERHSEVESRNKGVKRQTPKQMANRQMRKRCEKRKYLRTV